MLSQQFRAGWIISKNLGLYHDTQVEKFVRRVAGKLKRGSIALTKAIADITGQLELSGRSNWTSRKPERKKL